MTGKLENFARPIYKIQNGGYRKILTRYTLATLGTYKINRAGFISVIKGGASMPFWLVFPNPNIMPTDWFVSCTALPIVIAGAISASGDTSPKTFDEP